MEKQAQEQRRHSFCVDVEYPQILLLKETTFSRIQMLSSGRVFFFVWKISILVRVRWEGGDLIHLVISICHLYCYTLNYRFW